MWGPWSIVGYRTAVARCGLPLSDFANMNTSFYHFPCELPMVAADFEARNMGLLRFRTLSTRRCFVDNRHFASHAKVRILMTKAGSR